MRAAPLSIVAVTAGVHDVTGAETLHPEQALVLGPCRVIPQELPHVRCRQVDVDLDDAATRPVVVAQIARELVAGGDDPVVCYRQRRRWIPSVERRVLAPPAGPVYRPGGVYLVTGGLGGVGAIVAEHLARSVAATLVLLSRTVLPPRAQWAQAAVTDPDPDRRARLARLLRIERAGGTVRPIAGDAASPRDLAAALAEATRTFGAVHGLFHAAAVPGGGLVRLKTAAQADAVLRPKIDGLAAIDAVCRDSPLDLVVLFSSVSALLGEFGQVDYCAANAVLDAYARARRGRGPRVVAINWDTWRDDGMSRAALQQEGLPAVARARLEGELRDGLSSAEGCRALDAILASGLDGQVIVSTRPIARRVADVHALAAALVGDATDGPAPAREAPASSAAGATVDAVARIMAAVLGLPGVAPTDNFFDLGGHSLLATRLIARLGDELGVEISLRAFLESPTAADLAAHIDAAPARSAAADARGADADAVAEPQL
jgi:NAD(P)-dependent dehydrogenase (short-subunit alcohol dehydrogenase family)/acyl carrier protein